MSDDELEQLAVPGTLGDREDHFEDELSNLVQKQVINTNTTMKKVWEYIQLSLFGKANQLEEYILKTEPNDCSLIAKYTKVVDIDLSKQPTLSVDHVVLSTLHIPHPLINFIRNEGNKQVWEDMRLLEELEESPILVFVHGLGGQMSQFEPLIGLLSQCSEVMAVDLPGFGNSKEKFHENHKMVSSISTEDKLRISSTVAAMTWADFETDNIVNILYEFVVQNIPANKKIILIGHSMGTHLSIKLNKKLLEKKVEGLILLSTPKLFDDIAQPDQSAPKVKLLSLIYGFTFVPSLFNYFRIWDRLPGLNSTSVIRQMVDGPNNIYNKLRQFRWNLDVNSNIVLKYIHGFRAASYTDLIRSVEKFNDNPVDKRIYQKTLLLCGDKDTMTPPKYSRTVDEFLTSIFNRQVSCNIEIPNAGHSLLLIKPEYTSGKILNHIEHNFPERLHLSPSWVLTIKAQISGDKWGLKNELKWLQLKPISSNIARGNEVSPILAMKTLRQEDLNHSPTILEGLFYGTPEEQAKLPQDIQGKLVAIIDISADLPPYDPKTFNHIRYYKYPTVSKIVPDQIAIRNFIQLIDKIRKKNVTPGCLIAVHCHYGFNRTGFLICCYLIERLGWSVKDAVEAFKVAKPPGIKHPHFTDALYVKYER